MAQFANSPIAPARPARHVGFPGSRGSIRRSEAGVRRPVDSRASNSEPPISAFTPSVVTPSQSCTLVATPAIGDAAPAADVAVKPRRIALPSVRLPRRVHPVEPRRARARHQIHVLQRHVCAVHPRRDRRPSLQPPPLDPRRVRRRDRKPHQQRPARPRLDDQGDLIGARRPRRLAAARAPRRAIEPAEDRHRRPHPRRLAQRRGAHVDRLAALGRRERLAEGRVRRVLRPVSSTRGRPVDEQTALRSDRLRTPRIALRRQAAPALAALAPTARPAAAVPLPAAAVRRRAPGVVRAAVVPAARPDRGEEPRRQQPHHHAPHVPRLADHLHLPSVGLQRLPWTGFLSSLSAARFQTWPARCPTCLPASTTCRSLISSPTSGRSGTGSFEREADVPVPQSHLEELSRRLAEHEAGATDVRPWAEVEAELRAELAHRRASR